MFLLKKFIKVKGSSVAESLISMVIISICILMFTYVFNAIINQEDSLILQRALARIDLIVYEDMRLGVFTDETLTFDGYVIHKEVELIASECMVYYDFEIVIHEEKYYQNVISTCD